MRIHVRLWWSVHSSSGGLVGRTRIRLVLLFFLSFFFFFSFLDIFDVTSPNRHASDGYGTVADWQSRLVAWSVQFVPTARATFGFGIGHHLLGCDDTRSWIFVSWNENDFSVPPLDSHEKEKKKMSSVLTFGIKKWTGRDRVPPGNACAFFWFPRASKSGIGEANGSEWINTHAPPGAQSTQLRRSANKKELSFLPVDVPTHPNAHDPSVCLSFLSRYERMETYSCYIAVLTLQTPPLTSSSSYRRRPASFLSLLI